MRLLSSIIFGAFAGMLYADGQIAAAVISILFAYFFGIGYFDIKEHEKSVKQPPSKT